MQYVFVLLYLILSFINITGMINRIKTLKDHYGLSTRALAIKCGLNQPTLDRMLKGINALNLNCVSSILIAFPEISAEWLLRGEGEMVKQDASTKELERIGKLNNVVETLQEVIDVKNATIDQLGDRINQLENQIKAR